jgi:hypothetical protein
MGFEESSKSKDGNWGYFPETPKEEIREDLKIHTQDSDTSEALPEMGRQILEEIQREHDELDDHEQEVIRAVGKINNEKNRPRLH